MDGEKSEQLNLCIWVDTCCAHLTPSHVHPAAAVSLCNMHCMIQYDVIRYDTVYLRVPKS